MYFGENVTNIFEDTTIKTDHLRRAQEKDQEIMTIVRRITENQKPDFKNELAKFRPVWRSLYVDNGVLMKRTSHGGVIVVPEGKVDQVLYSVHGNPMASHYGISKCYYKLIGRFYFPYMTTRLADFISSCKLCLKRKMPSRSQKPMIEPIEIDYGDIGGCISYDFKGPLPVSAKSTLYQCSNRYVLVIIDHATKYVLAYPTPTQEACVVAEVVLSHWIPRFGVPRRVISDRAKTFTGKIMSTIYKALQVDVCLTASYNPSANGLVEQVNRNISSLLMVMLENEVENWPKQLNLLFSAYNSFPQSSTGYSPNYLVYGRELIEPLDLLLRMDAQGRKERLVVDELEERLKLRRRALEVLQVKAGERNEKVRQKSAETARVERYEVGEIVGFRAPPKSNKLYKSFEINHKVVKILSESTYVIKNMETGFERVINARKMRKLGKFTTPRSQENSINHFRNSDSSDSGEGEENATGGTTGAMADDEEDRKKISADKEKADVEQREGISVEKHEGGREIETWGGRLRSRETIKPPDRYLC